MPTITLVDSSSHIQCIEDNYNDAIWIYTADYNLEPESSEITETTEEFQGQETVEKSVNLDPSKTFPLPISCNEDTEAQIEYPLFISRLGRRERVSIPSHFLQYGFIKLDELIPFDFLSEQITKLTQQRFTFSIKLREFISLDELRENNQIQETSELNGQFKLIKLSHSVLDDNSQSDGLVIRDYPQIIGNLNKEIVWNIQAMVGAVPQLFQLQIQNYRNILNLEEYKELINDALQSRTEEPFVRIPKYIENHFQRSSQIPTGTGTEKAQQHQLFSDDKLLTALINEFKPNREYHINVTLRDPKKELFYPTNIPLLDQLIKDIHLKFLQNGLPVESTKYHYQKVLRELILYRHFCATRRDYITADVAQKTEVQGFHSHLLARIGHQGFAVEVISEPDVGNSRLDLLIEGIPTELKLEGRKTFSTAEIIESYKHQAADYTSRLNSPFGFLLVLDTVLDRDRATSPVNQDVKVVQVETVSGGNVLIVGIIVRIPRRASELTEIHHSRKK